MWTQEVDGTHSHEQILLHGAIHVTQNTSCLQLLLHTKIRVLSQISITSPGSNALFSILPLQFT